MNLRDRQQHPGCPAIVGLTCSACASRQPQGDDVRRGEPSESWPDGVWFNPRTQELVQVGQQFGRRLILRGFGASTMILVHPEDLWHKLGRAGEE